MKFLIKIIDDARFYQIVHRKKMIWSNFWWK
jgi:hypothetical protein